MSPAFHAEQLRYHAPSAQALVIITSPVTKIKDFEQVTENIEARARHFMPNSFAIMRLRRMLLL